MWLLITNLVYDFYPYKTQKNIEKELGKIKTVAMELAWTTE